MFEGCLFRDVTSGSPDDDAELGFLVGGPVLRDKGDGDHGGVRGGEGSAGFGKEDRGCGEGHFGLLWVGRVCQLRI